MSTDTDHKAPVSKRTRYIDKPALYARFPLSDSARQRWEVHPNPRLRLPKGVKFTVGGRLFWAEDEIDAWEGRVHEHTRAQQFDPDELPVDFLPTAREILEAEIVRLRDENAAQRGVIDTLRAEVTALRTELGIVVAENSALVTRNTELCMELTPPIEAEAGG